MQRRQVLRLVSYVIDWSLIIVAVFVFQRLGKIDGHRQRFSLTDISIQYNYTGPSTIPNYALVILSVIFPTVAIIAWVFLLETWLHRTKSSTAAKCWRLNSSLLGLALSISLSQVITNLFKVTVGRPRPDLLSRCIPEAGATDAASYGLTTSAVCTQTNSSLLQDGFRSFPSGHSSMAFSGLAYLTLFFVSRLHLFNNRGDTWKWIVVMLPVLVASLIAITRIMDNRHHPFDVLFGTSIGIITSFIAFYQFFPSLHSGENVYKPRFPASPTGTEDYTVTQNTTQNFGQAPTDAIAMR